MAIRILTLGKTKDDYLEVGISEYLKRISTFSKISLEVLTDAKLTKSIEISMVKKKEAEIILKNIKENEVIIALDEIGKQMNSNQFADSLEKLQVKGSPVFVIGGVYGLDESIRQKADLVLSFSSMTFTHQMIRLILLEQIYRAFTIISGKKYHY